MPQASAPGRRAGLTRLRFVHVLFTAPLLTSTRPQRIFLGILSHRRERFYRTLWNVGMGAAPAGGELTWLRALGRPRVSVRAHYGALPVAWLDGDRRRREIAVRLRPRKNGPGF